MPISQRQTQPARLPASLWYFLYSTLVRTLRGYPYSFASTCRTFPSPFHLCCNAWPAAQAASRCRL